MRGKNLMYKTKREFLSNLQKELERLGITGTSEIIADFELHFADSITQNLTEAEICSKLGSISEIAKQYAEEEIYPIVAVEASVTDASPPPSPPPPSREEPHNDAYSEYENSGIKINLGSFDDFKKSFGSRGFNISGLLACICVDILVLSWAIPALFGIMVAFVAVPFSLAVAGFATMVGGALGTGFFGFVSPLPGVVTFFTGLMLLSLGGLFGLLGVLFVKLFIKIIKCVIDWHGNMITGKPVFRPVSDTDATQQEVNV
jgi:uncharacterized membrane protein